MTFTESKLNSYVHYTGVSAQYDEYVLDEDCCDFRVICRE